MRCFILGMAICMVVIFSFAVFQQQENQNEKSAVEEIERIIFESGVKAGIEKIEKLKSESGNLLSLNENDVISLGNILLNAKKTDEAIKVLKLAVDMYPESSQSHYSLSLAYKNSGNREQEIEHFRKFTKLRFKKRADQIIENLDHPSATSSEEVIERYLAAIGGKERLQSIQTMIVKSKAVNIGREPVMIVRYYKRPGLYRQESIPHNNTYTVINDSGVWRVRNGVWTEIEGDLRDNYLSGSTIDKEFINYKDKGITYNFLGVEGIRNLAFYKIKKTYESGATYDLFFNVETNLLEMGRYAIPNGIHQTNYYDYMDKNGILIPRVLVVSSDTLLYPPYVVMKESIEINVPIDDLLFTK